MSDNCTSFDSVRHCLSTGQSIGLAFTAQSGFISLISVFIVFILIIRNVRRHVRNPPQGGWRLIEVPADAYMLCLFTFDLLQALGSALDVKWVREGRVKAGGFCNTQGSIQQLGETGVAMTTLVIAVHTFVTVLFSIGVKNLVVPFCVIAFIWVYVIAFVAIGAGVVGQTYFTPTPYWCWIGESYTGERIAGEYLWLFLALFGSVLLYVSLFLWNRGNITVDRAHWWHVRFYWHARAVSATTEHERARPGASSLAILAYPLVYAFVVLPFFVQRVGGGAERTQTRQ